MSPTRLSILILFLISCSYSFAQPSRINYFKAGQRMQQVAILDPGDLLLQQGILVTNQYEHGNISFQLSFDQEAWVNFGLGPLYSSIFSLKDQLGCYFEITTTYSENKQVRKKYYLNRGKCYSVYWNSTENCWDMKTNRCRQE